jgi:hypothetical protein
MEIENINEILTDACTRRMHDRIPYALFNKLFAEEGTTIYIAGNSCNAMVPNDIDVYPSNDKQFDGLEARLTDIDGLKLLCVSANAITVVQFCNYFHSSLSSLVNSFDFSHIQVGVSVIYDDWDGEDFSWCVNSVYYTDAYILSYIKQSTEYVGSDFPLSSLIRLNKYVKRGDFAGKSYIISAVNILKDVISRGYADYDDFKSQCAAVDLQLFQEVEGNALWDLYNVMCTKGLVKSPRGSDMSEFV